MSRIFLKYIMSSFALTKKMVIDVIVNLLPNTIRSQLKFNYFLKLEPTAHLWLCICLLVILFFHFNSKFDFIHFLELSVGV